MPPDAACWSICGRGEAADRGKRVGGEGGLGGRGANPPTSFCAPIWGVRRPARDARMVLRRAFASTADADDDDAAPRLKFVSDPFCVPNPGDFWEEKRGTGKPESDDAEQFAQ